MEGVKAREEEGKVTVRSGREGNWLAGWQMSGLRRRASLCNCLKAHRITRQGKAIGGAGWGHRKGRGREGVAKAGVGGEAGGGRLWGRLAGRALAVLCVFVSGT